MKTYPNYLRALAIFACAFGLAACGGGDGTIKLGGTITGLNTTGLVLSNGVSALTVPVNATSFQFPSQISSNYSYSVGALAQPLDSTCVVTNGDGVAGTTDINNITIACTQTSFKLGGNVTGLKTDGLVIANGPTTLAIPANSKTFVFASKVPAGSFFGVTILFQPAGATCTVNSGATSGLGLMPSNDYLNIGVTCV